MDGEGFLLESSGDGLVGGTAAGPMMRFRLVGGGSMVELGDGIVCGPLCIDGGGGGMVVF